MEDQLGVRLVIVGLNGGQRGMIPFVASTQDLFHLMPMVPQHNLLQHGDEIGVYHDGDLIDALVMLKNLHRVLNHHLSSHFHELFGR